MLDTVRRRLTYANVMSTLAVFIALGGSSYAAIAINGRDIKNRSIPATKLRTNTLTGAQIRESTLGRVTRARIADNATRLEGLPAAVFKIRCPIDTFPAADVCLELTSRAALTYGGAVSTCMSVGTPTGPGRRLPTYNELMAGLASFDLAPGGELTSLVYPSTANPGRVDALVITTETGGAVLTPDTAAGSKAYRCVTDPLN